MLTWLAIYITGLYFQVQTTSNAIYYSDLYRSRRYTWVNLLVDMCWPVMAPGLLLVRVWDLIRGNIPNRAD